MRSNIDFINKPEKIEYNDSDVIREYKRIHDAKTVARIFCIHTNKVRAILKRAGVLEDQKQQMGKLSDIGMSEKIFCSEIKTMPIIQHRFYYTLL